MNEILGFEHSLLDLWSYTRSWPAHRIATRSLYGTSAWAPSTSMRSVTSSRCRPRPRAPIERMKSLPRFASGASWSSAIPRCVRGRHGGSEVRQWLPAHHGRDSAAQPGQPGPGEVPLAPGSDDAGVPLRVSPPRRPLHLWPGLSLQAVRTRARGVRLVRHRHGSARSGHRPRTDDLGSTREQVTEVFLPHDHPDHVAAAPLPRATCARTCASWKPSAVVPCSLSVPRTVEPLLRDPPTNSCRPWRTELAVYSAS